MFKECRAIKVLIIYLATVYKKLYGICYLNYCSI